MGFRPEDFASIPAVGSVRSPALASATGTGTPGIKRQEELCPPLELKEKGAPPICSTDPDARLADAGTPLHFFCPISTLIMRDPVVLPTGQTYDRDNIERWLQQGNCSCPMTGQQLTPPVAVTPNVALRHSIEEWCAKYAPWMLDSCGHVRPVPADAQFVPLPKQSAPVPDPDLALAIRLQQQELTRLAEERAAASRRGGSATSSRRSSGSGSRSSSRRRARRRWSSCVVVQLLLVSVSYITLFVLAMWQGGWKFAPLSLNPFVGPNQSGLMSQGALTAAALTKQHEWWRLIASPFINAGIIQVGGCSRGSCCAVEGADSGSCNAAAGW